ncbi:hypothetical protein ACWIGX_31235 [Streptomyces nigrescens]
MNSARERRRTQADAFRGRHAAGGAGGVGERAVDARRMGRARARTSSPKPVGGRTRLAAVDGGTRIRTRRRTGMDDRENFSGKATPMACLFSP